LQAEDITDIVVTVAQVLEHPLRAVRLQGRHWHVRVTTC
jgi:hypothetical protein